MEYVLNAPVHVNGGDGYDKLRVIGTEFSDSIVITALGVFGIGLQVDYAEIEELQVDAAEGNDTFYVLSTSPDVLTTLYGGLGSDRFLIGADVPELRSAAGVLLYPATTGPHTLSGIGSRLLTIEGASGTGTAGGLGDPVLLPGETNALASVGNVLAFARDRAGGVDRHPHDRRRGARGGWLRRPALARGSNHRDQLRPRRRPVLAGRGRHVGLGREQRHPNIDEPEPARPRVGTPHGREPVRRHAPQRQLLRR